MIHKHFRYTVLYEVFFSFSSHRTFKSLVFGHTLFHAPSVFVWHDNIVRNVDLIYLLEQDVSLNLNATNCNQMFCKIILW